MSHAAGILTVATYNIELGVNEKKLVENIVTFAKDGVDVICLQEIVNSPLKKLFIDTVLENLGSDWDATTHLEEKKLKTNIGTCILWNKKRLEFEREKKIDLPKIKRVGLHEFIFAKLVGGTTFPLQRRALTCTFLFKNKTIQITSIHVDHIGGANHRIQQIQYFLTKTERNNYEIICGDFNTFDLLQTGKEKIMIKTALGHEFTDASEHTGPTADLYNMHMQTGRIFKTFIKLLHIHLARKLDYIWVKNFDVVACEKKQISGSDHFPVIAKLSIKK